MKNRTIIISDAHGCSEEFAELLKKVSFNKESDRFIFGGDAIDRGYDSLGCLNILKESNAECVLANHEEKLLRWWNHDLKHKANSSYENPIKPNPGYETFTQSDIDYIKTFPLHIDLGFRQWIVVHAGLMPNVPFDKQTSNVKLRIRHLDFNHKFLPLQKALKTKDKYFWADRWEGPENIIYGHMVSSLDKPYITHSEKTGAMTYGIDTGCVFGGNLTCLIIEHTDIGNMFNIVQVKAKEEYCKLGFKEE